MHTVIGKVIYDLVSANSTISDVVGTHIYQEAAPTEVKTPYILFTVMAGGEENASPTDSFDVSVLITAVTKNQTQAKVLADALRTALHKVTPVYTDGWKAYSSIRQNQLFSRDVESQQVKFYQFGSYFRFRGHK